MPRALSTSAIPPKLVMPVACIARMTGSTLAANRFASAIWTFRPSCAATGALRGFPSLAPCRLRAASAAFVRFADQSAFRLGQRCVEVQHKRVCVRAELGHKERHPLRHQARNEGDVAREPVKLCHDYRAAQPASGFERCPWLRPPHQRVAALATLRLDLLGDDGDVFGLGEPGDCLSLRLDPEPRPALGPRRDAVVGDRPVHPGLHTNCEPPFAVCSEAVR